MKRAKKNEIYDVDSIDLQIPQRATEFEFDYDEMTCDIIVCTDASSCIYFDAFYPFHT